MKPYSKYKPSNIEWIGEIPEHWRKSKVKFIANVKGRIGFKGYTVADLVNEGEGALTLGAKHISKSNTLNLSVPEYISWEKYFESPEIMVEIGDVIVTQRGSLGKVVVISEDIGKATINPSMVILKNTKLNSWFIFYYFNSDVILSMIDLVNTSTAIPMISQNQLENFTILAPPLLEQQAIVSYLDTKTTLIDELISKKEHKIELLKENRAAIINHAVTKGLDDTVKYKDSGIEWIGEIPEHWVFSKLRFVTLSVQTGSTPSTEKDEYFEGGDFNWYTPADFSTESILLESSKRKITKYAVDQGTVRLFPKHSVLMVGIGATLGKIGITNSFCSSNQQINSIQFNSKVIPLFGAYYLFSNNINIVGLANFATLPILNQSQTKEIPIIIPLIKEQEEIVVYLDQQTALIDKAVQLEEQKIATLKEYRQALISDVVTGKVSVL
jgi:type I restriction enzyme, S subunit